MPELFISPEAKRDLRDIQAYIGDKLERPKAALNVVSGIIEKIASLRQFPQKGTLLASKVKFAASYRYVCSGNYLIFYRYKNDKIFIIRIIYSRRDYIKILFPELKNDEPLEQDENQQGDSR